MVQSDMYIYVKNRDNSLKSKSIVLIYITSYISFVPNVNQMTLKTFTMSVGANIQQGRDQENARRN